MFFEIYPETQKYFEDTDIPSFAPRKFMIIADFFIDAVENPSFAEYHVAFEVYRHTPYGLTDKEYYFVLIDTFQTVIIEGVGDQTTDEMKEAWSDVGTAMKSYIQEGAELYL